MSRRRRGGKTVPTKKGSRVLVELNAIQTACIDYLVETGMRGLDRADAIRRLLDSKLDEMIEVQQDVEEIPRRPQSARLH